MDKSDKILKSIRDAMKSTEKDSLHMEDFDLPKEDGPKVACFLFATGGWRPPTRFEMQLRNKLDDLGGPFTMDMPCRIRRIGKEKPGIVVEFRGSEEKCQALCEMKGLDSLEICQLKLSKVWEKDAVDDPLGDLTDFFLVHCDTLEDCWKHISSGKDGLDKDLFQTKVKSMGFVKDANIAFHALEDGTGNVTAKSFLSLRDCQSFAPVPVTQENASIELVSFSAAVFTYWPDLATAFDGFNEVGDGELTFRELVAGVKKIGWKPPKGSTSSKIGESARKVFEELDTMQAGFLRAREFARLGAADIRKNVPQKEMPQEIVKDAVDETGKDEKDVLASPGKSKAKATAKAKGTAKAGKAGADPRASSASPSKKPVKSPAQDEPEGEPLGAPSPAKPSKSSAKARPKSAPASKERTAVSKVGK